MAVICFNSLCNNYSSEHRGAHTSEESYLPQFPADGKGHEHDEFAMILHIVGLLVDRRFSITRAPITKETRIVTGTSRRGNQFSVCCGHVFSIEQAVWRLDGHLGSKLGPVSFLRWIACLEVIERLNFCQLAFVLK